MENNEAVGLVLTASDVANLICREVAELPDRNSRPEWPAAMRVTHTELHSIVLDAISQWTDISSSAGQPIPSNAAAPAQQARGNDMRDAYAGARDDLLDWKRRALEAEALVRNFVREVNGPTFMGKPASSAPMLNPVEPRALALSIAELEAWEKRLDGDLLTQGESESVCLVLHELKRLRASDGAKDICQGCRGAGGTMTGGSCAECYGQGSYSGASEFVDGRAADVAQPSRGIPTEAGIAWQSGATWPNERKAVTVEGHAWYRHDHPRFAANSHTPAAVRVGRVEVREGKTASFAFEQFDGLEDGEHGLYACAPR